MEYVTLTVILKNDLLMHIITFSRLGSKIDITYILTFLQQRHNSSSHFLICLFIFFSLFSFNFLTNILLQKYVDLPISFYDP